MKRLLLAALAGICGGTATVAIASFYIAIWSSSDVQTRWLNTGFVSLCVAFLSGVGVAATGEFL